MLLEDLCYLSYRYYKIDYKIAEKELCIIELLRILASINGIVTKSSGEKTLIEQAIKIYDGCLIVYVLSKEYAKVLKVFKEILNNNNIDFKHDKNIFSIFLKHEIIVDFDVVAQLPNSCIHKVTCYPYRVITEHFSKSEELKEFYMKVSKREDNLISLLIQIKMALAKDNDLLALTLFEKYQSLDLMCESEAYKRFNNKMYIRKKFYGVTNRRNIKRWIRDNFS